MPKILKPRRALDSRALSQAGWAAITNLFGLTENADTVLWNCLTEFGSRPPVISSKTPERTARGVNPPVTRRSLRNRFNFLDA
jgi:hypothetical protein